MRLLLATTVFLMASCGASRSIRPFYSDGCSLFPDGDMGDRKLWCDCCFAHDIAYWMGGTREDRRLADQALRSCVLQRTGSPRLAAVMYDGVRLGGAPYFPNWYRWAYGWPYGRTWEPLTEPEAAQARVRLEEYYRVRPGGYCQSR